MVASRIAARISAGLISSSSMNFSRIPSSYCDTTSSSFWRYSAAWSARSAGMSVMSNLAPSSSSCQTRAFISTRSTTPAKLPSAPIGIWVTAMVAPRRSTMESTAL